MKSISKMIVNVENFPTCVKERFPFTSEGEVSSSPLYKNNFESIFQSPDLLANGALGNVAEHGRLGKAAGFNEIAKDFKGFDLHDSGKNKID
jgi:hypothetical protein